MRIFINILILLITLSQSVLAVEASLTEHNGQINLNLTDIDLPQELLGSELESGLPNNISVVVRIYSNKEPVKKSIINAKVVFDLWDEIYTVESVVINQLAKSTYASRDLLIEHLKRLSLPILDSVQTKKSIVKLRVSVQTVYNPVDNEKLKKIQAWIMSSNGYSQSESFKVADSHGDPLQRSTNGLRFQKLFEKLVEDYAPEEGFSAQWKSELKFINLDGI